MTSGLLWRFGMSSDSAGIVRALEQGIGYYRAKYGAEPSVILMHVADEERAGVTDVDGVELRFVHGVLRGHCWISALID